MDNRYFKKIIGKLIYLSPINLDDCNKYAEWMNDLQVTKYLANSSQQISMATEKKWLDDAVASKNGYIFSIINKEANNLMGSVGLHKIDHLHQTAAIGVFVGDKNYWNRGIGTEAVNLALDYAFNVLNLHNIWLEVISYNNRAVHAYKKIGFSEIGRRRQCYQIAGERYDVIYMDLLASEFKSIYLKKLIQDDSAEEDFGKKLELA